MNHAKRNSKSQLYYQVLAVTVVAVVHSPFGPCSLSEFENFSIPASVTKILDVKEFLTKHDALAGTFETVLTRTTPN